MTALNSHAYKNIQTVVAQLFILTMNDNKTDLNQIEDTISTEAKNMAAGGLEYIHNVIATNEQEQTEEEQEQEEDEEDYINRRLSELEKEQQHANN